MAITAKEIESALFHKYGTLQDFWVVLREVTIDDMELVEGLLEKQTKTYRSDYIAEHAARRASVRPTKRRIDMLLVSHKRSGTKIPNERIALEIKVTRADFKRDTAEKRAAWMAVTDKFAYVAPVGMIKVEELPEGCGLIEYDPTATWDKLKWKKKAPLSAVEERRFHPSFMHYLMSRLHGAEAKLRALSAA